MSEEQARQIVPRAAITATNFGGRMTIMPTDFEQVYRMAQLFARAGDMVPAQYRDNPDAAATAILWGMELGLSPINALQGIAIIKGRASVWGDHLKAVAMSHADFVDCIEEIVSEDGKEIGYKVTAKRKNRADVVRQFTIMDAAKADLIVRAQGERGKGPWLTYPIRQCMFRARSWALRDQFPDALRGIYSAEEASDIPETAEVVGSVSIPEPVALEEAHVEQRTTATQAPAAQAAEASEPAQNDGVGARDMEPAAQLESADATETPAPAAAASDSAQEVPHGDNAKAGALKIDLPASPLRMLRARYIDAGMTEEQVLTGFGKNISLTNINEAFAYIKEHGK